MPTRRSAAIRPAGRFGSLFAGLPDVIPFTRVE
jgi:hypothetical protein